jgi:hypothetical protein
MDVGPSSGIYCFLVRWKSTNISEQNAVSIFGVEEVAKQHEGGITPIVTTSNFT